MSAPPAVPEACVAFAESLADDARAIARRWFRQDPPTERKADLSPVTAADREIEALFRDRIATAFPDHGVLGEEQAATGLDADWLWVVDPIDGTKAFVTGKPTFTTLIALTWRGDPLLGLIEAPATGERWLGRRGAPSLFNGRPIRVRACARLGEALLYASSPGMFRADAAAPWARLREAVAHDLYGADAYQYGMLAAGWCDLVCEADLKAYDYCAVAPVIAGAGGVITHWSGAPVSAFGDGRILAAGDPARHAEALALLAGTA